MRRTVTATEARVHFGELLRRVVEERTPVVVERGGKPLVVVLSVDEYERLRAGQPESEDWWELARRSREAIHRRRGGRPLPSIDDVFDEMRDERDAQLLDNLRRR